MTRAPGHSLRFRLMLGSVLGVILAVVLAGLFIGNLYRIHTVDRFQAELDHHLTELVALISIDPRGQAEVAQPLSDPQFHVPNSGLYWQVDRAGETRRSASLAADTRLDPSHDEAWQTKGVGTEALRQRSTHARIDGHPVTVTIASAQSLLDRQVADFWMDLLWSMSVVGLLLLGGAMALVRFGLAPVRRLGEEIGRLRHGEIERLGLDVPIEFAPVVARLNGLLDAQAQLIARARTESGNLAHNLRTPLALVIDEAEQLKLAGHGASADFLLQRCETMQRQIDHHLTRAAAAGTRGAGTLTEVAALLGQIVDAMRRLHARRDIRIETDLPLGLRLACDRGDLAEILSNLIDNACKWAAHRVIVTGGDGWIEVRDDGGGIPADKREAVLAIGSRLDPSTPGTGLGLAATADLLNFYEGQLLLETADEGGLLVRILIPG